MAEPTDGNDEPLVSCDLQGGTLSVYADRVVIDRSKRSMFEDKTIDMEDIWDVEYSGGITTGHVQIRQVGLEPDEPGMFSHPVDENTLYFPRTKRSSVKRARDAIIERAGGQQ